MALHLTAAEIGTAFDEAFDQALVFHGFADFMRDYDLIVYATADPATGIAPEYALYRFRHCVCANVTTAVGPDVWARSLDDRLTEYETGVDLDGYVWGVKWQALDPGMRLVRDSDAASEWSDRLGIGMHEAVIETNGHTITLVFSGVEVTVLQPGWAPFTVSRAEDRS